MKSKEVLKLISSGEHHICDARLTSRKVDKVVLRNGTVDIRKICTDSNYKLTGGRHPYF